MELVRGMPISEYCDLERLSPRQRLALFINVCQAVQHAHQKGIIHRDLKPSNVMITLHDGTPVVNLDHVCWVTPTQALELARRAGLALAAYHLVKPLGARQRALRELAWKFLPLEWSCPDYIYEFA